MGVHTLNASEPSQQRLQLKPGKLHRRWDPFSRQYDIALLRLRQPIKFSRKVKTICLDEHVFPPGSYCYITGWGVTPLEG